MKVNLKDLDAYIYATVIFPLKQLNVNALRVVSPLKTPDGTEIRFWVDREPLTGSYRRNYQRARARHHLKWNIYVGSGRGDERVAAQYNDKNHSVRIFADAFRHSPNLRIALGRIEDAFTASYPFTNVKILEENLAQKTTGDGITHGLDINGMPF